MNKSSVPKVSIQMCTYNRARFIKDAIDSVMLQTYGDWELLILDDASTDDTEKIVLPYLSDPRIRYVKNESNMGIAKHRNKGLSLSRGEYIAVLDSDDYWIDREKLEKQVAILDKKPECSLVGTHMHIVDEEGTLLKKITYQIADKDIRSHLLLKNQFCHSSVLYRKSAALHCHGYDEALFIWEDYDLWLKIGTEYQFENADIFGTAYRKHAGQSDSKKRELSLRTLDEIIKKYKKQYPRYFFAVSVNFLRKIRG